MNLFAGWLKRALNDVYIVREIRPFPIFLNNATRRLPFAKWLGYIDQYIVFPFVLYVKSTQFDLVFVADHGDSPVSVFVPGAKLLGMVHDTIALRQARGLLLDAPKVKASGRILQRLILHSLRRFNILITNPGPVRTELVDLGVASRLVEVGCPVDLKRFSVCSDRAVSGKYVINVAGSGWRKRKKDLLYLWAEVEKRSDITLILVGYTDFTELNLIDVLNLRNVLIFNDAPDELLTSLYEGSDALILSAHYEGLCIPIVEAAALGVPVVGPKLSDSYLDTFGSFVRKIDLSNPPSAATELLELLPSLKKDFVPPTNLPWFGWAEFQNRVRRAVEEAITMRFSPQKHEV